MKRLVFTGKHFEFRPDEKPDPVPQLGDMPKRKQVSSNARVYRAVLGPKTKATQYRPGPFLSLADDQCRWTVHGNTMCGAKVGRGSYCDHHSHVARWGSRVEAAE